MEITQIQMSYLELEDRMVMRINLGENKHVAFLLTRRICRFMLENLSAFLGLPVLVDVTAAPVRPEISSHPEEIIESLGPFAGLDIQTPFEERKSEDNILPAGKDKELVMNAACNRNQEGVSFTFFIQDAESLNLNLPRKLALGIHQLMAGIATQAQWFSGLTAIAMTGESNGVEDSEQTKTSVIYH